VPSSVAQKHRWTCPFNLHVLYICETDLNIHYWAIHVQIDSPETMYWQYVVVYNESIHKFNSKIAIFYLEGNIKDNGGHDTNSNYWSPMENFSMYCDRKYFCLKCILLSVRVWLYCGQGETVHLFYKLWWTFVITYVRVS